MINREHIDSSLDTLTGELFCIDNHPLFRTFKQIADRHEQGITDDNGARNEIVNIFVRDWDAEGWFREQFGWVCCLVTVLDCLRPFKDELTNFKDLDDYAHADLKVLDFIEQHR